MLLPAFLTTAAKTDRKMKKQQNSGKKFFFLQKKSGLRTPETTTEFLDSDDFKPSGEGTASSPQLDNKKQQKEKGKQLYRKDKICPPK